MAAAVPLLGAGIQLFDAWMSRRQIDKWIKFVLKLAFSYFATWSIAMGGALVAHVSFLVALGQGMIAGGGVVIYLWIRDPLTKGMFLAVPQQQLDQVEQQSTGSPVLFDGGNK